MANSAPDVLIVAKFRFFGDFVADLLNSAGYECRVAGDADEALEMFRQLRPALVVSDRIMPGMNTSGIDLLKQVQREDPHAAVVFLTGDSSPGIFLECLKLGAFDVVGKPIHVDELLHAVARALEQHHRLLSELRQ